MNKDTFLPPVSPTEDLEEVVVRESPEVRSQSEVVETDNWKTEKVVQNGLANSSYRCQTFQHSPVSKLPEAPNEVFVHAYNGATTMTAAGNFYSSLPLASEFRQRVAAQLNVAESQLAQRLTFVVQNSVLLETSGEQALLRPQWAFARHYNGENVESNVLSQVRVLHQDNAHTDHHFSESVSFHPDGSGGMAISSNNLALGFTNTEVHHGANKVVLSNTKFNSGPIAGEMKTSVNIIFSPAAYQEFVTLCESGMEFGAILRTLHSKGYLSVEFMNLFGV